ncbi:glycosyltransferase family 4 protein [uncultured Marinobacter sp.]|uniref:glycosyltransferase family 4 protein n=1 Tax=uncultured Marinobacter sp. TaxID=187379 RepID=UPI0026196C47|nr:glycosyltransferase family 4 protein [uncultured Marinobacter sp.]
MKIGYLYNLNIFPPKGGNQVHALELTQGFLNAGHQVAVLDDPTAPGVWNFSSVEPGAIPAFMEVIDVLYIRIDARYLSDWPQALECMSLADGIPVIWEINSPANETLAYSWLGGRKAGKKESPLRYARRWFHANRKKPGIFREESLRTSLASKVSAAICVSSALGRYAKEALGIQKVVVLPNGGPLIAKEDIQTRRSTRNSSAFTVFYSGSAIYPWQGMDLMSGAITLAQKDAPDIRFVLAVNQRTDSLPSGPNVEIREQLNRQGIIEAVCASDACVALHPDYSWSPYGFHNSPMKLFEYMACMVPVVTSNRAQMAELIEHRRNGLLCSDAPEDILAQLLWLRDHPDAASDIGKNGWRDIQTRFSWPHNVDKTLQVFEQAAHASVAYA